LPGLLVKAIALMRWFLVAAFALIAGVAEAEPAAHWQDADPSALGWSLDRLKTAEAQAGVSPTVAVMIVEGDRVVARWGDVTRKANVRSIRKSLLATLYGAPVADGRIKLDSTLADLKFDDKPPSLTEAEKQATVRELLEARSGVYHPAAYETADMKAKRPERGSHVHGTFWYYNNWDFNALGAIYRKATGEDIFASFAGHIAGPIGMEDFTASDGRDIYAPSSDYPAYTFRLTAQDAARFGLLIEQGGRWGESQLVSPSWIAEETRAYTQADPVGLGYGYLWWTLPPEIGGFTALGNGGQGIAVIPARRLVIVRVADPPESDHGVGFVTLVKLIVAAQEP
jgi:CubicO group peptidase (beta-lactamase class C family)